MTASVLIVDDSLTVRMDLSEAFEAAGVHAVLAASIAEARGALEREAIGLVVLDVLLPDGDGVELLKSLRFSAERSALPVILLSSEAEVKDRIRGLKTGADEYVGKPYDTKYVVAKARDLMRLKAPAAPAGKGTVLVIDDSPTFRQGLADALRGAGYNVLLASGGDEGLALMSSRRPNAIIVDGVMPDMDGATLIRRVRLDAAFRAMPCLLLTASEEGSAQLRALEAGADAFVRKDEDMEVILARLGAVMRRPADTPFEDVASLLGPRKILAVDDSRTYLHEIAAALRDEGYDVSLAHSGEEAIDLLAVQPVDCILMDLMMPGIGGQEACLRIKAAPGVRDIPLILLTALDDRGAMLEGLAAGADDYISKSSEFEVLRARVRAQIRRKQFEDENRRIREELLSRELEAAEERTARELAETRAALVEELERKVEERTRELEATIVERRHAERMASVGMLSASIAHEINNPLAVVTGNLELISLGLNSLAQDPSLGQPGGVRDGFVEQVLGRLAATEEPLRDALEASERVREIVRDLRIFSRSDDDAAAVPVDVHKVLESSIRMASNEVRHRAGLVREFGDIPWAQGNESRLGQVFLNLIVNAAQAIPEGHVAANRIVVKTELRDDDRIVVSVRDSGVGIPADKLESVFKPFFTTKPAGQGTGLGLAICHRIITELGGDIQVESEVGKGTVFRIILQRARTAPVVKEAAAPEVKPAMSRRGRVLVVDDEATLGVTVQRMLSPQYDVTVVTSAGAALARVDSGETYDVILSDLMMPEMTGTELYQRLRQSHPAQADRMIFMTGGAFSPDAAEFLSQTAIRSIEKPFRAANLQKLLQSVLEAG